jgi:predicted peptidase
MRYNLFLPNGYHEDTARVWPLLLFLHGIKKRGDDMGLLDNYGLHAVAERSEGFRFIVVTPQCPADAKWPQVRDTVLALLSEVETNYRVDSERIYATGFSMGGNGVWDLAAHAPDRFAAAAPLAGWYDPKAAPAMKGLPIWTFHGEADDVVSADQTMTMVRALEGIGGNVKYTSYPELKHPIMEEAYGNPRLYEWFLSHKRVSEDGPVI